MTRARFETKFKAIVHDYEHTIICNGKGCHSRNVFKKPVSRTILFTEMVALFVENLESFMYRNLNYFWEAIQSCCNRTKQWTRAIQTLKTVFVQRFIDMQNAYNKPYLFDWSFIKMADHISNFKLQILLLKSGVLWTCKICDTSSFILPM